MENYYNPSTTSLTNWANQVIQYIVESKIIKATSVTSLIDAINEYIGNRPSQIGNIEEKEGCFFAKVDIMSLAWNYSTAFIYYPVEPAKRVCTYTTDNSRDIANQIEYGTSRGPYCG